MDTGCMPMPEINFMGALRMTRRDLVFMPSHHYDAPSGKVGRCFFWDLVEEMRGEQDRQWNLERFIVF